MATIKIILRKDKLSKKDNKAPLYIRITQDRRSKFLALGISIEPKYWNEEKSIVKKGAVNYQEINAYILKRRAEIEAKSLVLDTRTSKLTSYIIKEKIQKEKTVDFFSYSKAKLEELKTSLTYSTYDVYKIRLGKFKKYCGGKELFFEDIDLDFLYKYDKYQIEELNNKPYTVINNFKLIKNMLTHASLDGVANVNLSALKKHKINVEQPSIKYLTEEQLKQILNYNTSKLTKPVYLDMFIFACYSGGLRFSDIVNLKWEDYIEEEQRIVKLIQKTKRTHQIKLPLKANEIITKYKNDTSKPNDYIFKLLKNNENEIVPERIRNSRVKEHNVNCNKVLKKVSEDIGLPFKLTFHSSRHTFATIALKRGMRIEYVSKILDHAHINTTQIYAKIINKELDMAMNIMDF